MVKPLALIIHSSEAPLGGISKLVEARDCSVHLSRTVEEAERVLTAFPTDQQKFIFAELTLCQDNAWNVFTAHLREHCANLALICYDPLHLQGLYGLFGHSIVERSFPSRWPILALDRAWVRPRHSLLALKAHRTPLACIASDHLPVKALVATRAAQAAGEVAEDLRAVGWQ